MSEKRESLGSRLGFIFLSAGCAIGLGNVWRFPYITGKYGGALFVLVYLFFLVALGLPIMVMEFSVGRASRQNIGKALKTLEAPGTKWHWYGPLAIAGNYLLMMFYTAITGWLLYYCYASATGAFSGLDTAGVNNFFGGLLSNPLQQTFWMILAVVLGFVVVGMGLNKGVENITKVMMFCLLILILILAVHSLTLPGSSAGLKFYLLPDFSKVTDSGFGEVVFAAMGQAFFTLSLGIGAMEIFGSYINKNHTLTGESVRIIILDTFVALTSGLIIFPAAFAYGINPDTGPQLLFVTMPNIFNHMAGSRIWGTLFFIFMSFAALSTLIAVFENITSYWMDVHHWTRTKACIVNAIAIMILSLPCILGFNVLSGFQPLGSGTGVLDLEDFFVSTTLLPLGSLLTLIFCTHKFGWGWESFLKEADEGKGLKFPAKLKFYFKWILPLIIIYIFVDGYIKTFSKLF